MESLSSTLSQEKMRFQQKKKNAAKSKTKLNQQLEELWMRYESLRKAHEILEKQFSESEVKNTDYILREQSMGKEKEELIQKNNYLIAKVSLKKNESFVFIFYGTYSQNRPKCGRCVVKLAI